MGEFKDDRLQNITGNTGALLRNQNAGSVSGAFNTDLTRSLGTGNIEQQWISLSFNASRVVRTGSVTHGKQIGVKYIIKVL